MKNNLKSVDIATLTMNSVYQRCFEPKRCKELKYSIQKEGYWDHSIIVVNSKLEVVDGQHRVQAARDCGIKRIVVNVVDFKNKEEEARFFWVMNNYKSTHLLTKDYWFARYQSADILANALYAINDCDKSSLKNNIALKGHDTRSKLNIAAALTLINYAVTGTSTHWERRGDSTLSKGVEKIGISEVVIRASQTYDFISLCFGRISINNTVPYKFKNFKSIITFIMLLEKSGFIENRDTIKKIQSFIFTSEFDRIPQSMKVQSLVNHFNSGKTKNRIKYEV